MARAASGQTPVDGSTGGKRLAAVVLVGVLTLAAAGVYAWRSGARVEDLAGLGYPGVFLVMVLSGASVFFPAPGQAAIFAAGALWNPYLVGLAAGLGNAVGELTGYAAGRAGAGVLGEKRLPGWWGTLKGILNRYGFFGILALALIPNPAFDAVGILAGSLGFPIRRFWLACAIGNSVKYALLANLGDFASVRF
jgi:membrane protein YqaA with SNARE-associated domain